MLFLAKAMCDIRFDDDIEDFVFRKSHRKFSSTLSHWEKKSRVILGNLFSLSVVFGKIL